MIPYPLIQRLLISIQTKSVFNLSDGHTELLFHSKEKDVALMSQRVWTHMGAKPYEDNTPEEDL
jgi:hypothetical protein